MTIKNLTQSDITEIVKFQQEQKFTDGWTKEMFESAFTGDFEVLGCYEYQRLIGYVSYSIGLDFADINDVLVNAEYRRSGIATKLINRAIQRITNSSLQKIFLEVRKTNFSAIALYKKMGFTEVNERKNYYSDGETAIVMVKEI